MIEKYFFISTKEARRVLSVLKDLKPSKLRFKSYVYLFDEYAVSAVPKINYRASCVYDEDLEYLDELIMDLMDLNEFGVSVMPILGYCYNKSGSGCVIRLRADGSEIYDDSIMKKCYVKKNWFYYLPESGNFEEYIVSRTNYLSKVPQQHFDKFMSDIITLVDNNILLDFYRKSNFFYDEKYGFQFTYIDSYGSYQYGTAKASIDGRIACSYHGFVLCHCAEGSKIFSNLALDEQAISKIGDENLHNLIRDNLIIFEKCKIAMLNNGISHMQIDEALQSIKIYGLQ